MKYLLFFILLLSSLFSDEINKYQNVKSFLISENGSSYKQVTYMEYKKKKIKDFTIKIEIDKQTLIDKNYYLTIVSDLESLAYTNVKYIKKDHMIVINLDSKTPKELYFKYSYKEPKRGEFRFNVVSAFEYKYILPYEGILYGLAYGIIFSAFIYYLVIYVSTRRLCFIYYSTMQFFALLSLIGFAYVSYLPYPPQFEQALIDIFETSAFLFTFLFTKEILNTKKELPFMNNVLNFFIALNVLDLLGILVLKYSYLYEEMYFYICFLVPTIAGVTAVYKGNKNAIFYTLGWFTLFCFVYSYEHDFIPLSGIYIIHLAAPMESLIFSFALAFMLKDIVRKQNEQEKMLIHKSKLASVGEMINNIAHQWRQPLMHLGYINMNLEMSSENDEFEKEFFIKKIKESNSQIRFMSNTIDDFRDFYKVQKEKEEFKISNACNLAINIISSSLKKKKIELNLNIKEDGTIKGYENEYAQVVLNLLTNSVDVLLERKTKNPKINVETQKLNNRILVKVCDNAGGIEEKFIDEVFNPYFSTKKRGSGIGLYMSQLIIQSHFNGNIKVYNKEKGACFIIEV